MSITTYGKLQAEIEAPNDRIQINKSGVAVAMPQSSWRSVQLPGATPTVPVVPTNLTAGSLGQQNGGANALRMVGASLFSSASLLWLCDRLSHQAGLSGTVITPQVTNLPTAPLTRYTTGDNVLITLEIYTIIGATGTTVSASYTNQAGVAGRTTPLVTFGGTNFREVSRAFILPFQQGDTGARSVESVTVTATTGTAGDFGVTLIKPLVPFVFPALQPQAAQMDGYVYLGGFLPEIVDDSCLYFINHAGVASPVFTGELRFAEDT